MKDLMDNNNEERALVEAIKDCRPDKDSIIHYVKSQMERSSISKEDLAIKAMEKYEELYEDKLTISLGKILRALIFK